MIQDLLDSNRIKVGEKIPLTIEKLEIDAIVLESLDNFITLNGDRFIYNRDQEGITGYWSHSGIIRVLDNLINNAIKYGELKGSIEVSVSTNGTFLQLTVHNSGNPIPKEDLENIFDAYKRSKTAEKGSQKGWGLGLTLVRGVAEAMGGHVTVESDLLTGTLFTIFLPLDAREFYERY
jgi:signal transduction histidine kinase